MAQEEPKVDPIDPASTSNRRWYQFSIWHLLVAMTVLALGFSIVNHIVNEMLKPEPTEVRGTVYLDEKPLANGLITLVLADGKKKQRICQPIRNGEYTFPDAIESGVYLVEISSPRTTGNVTIETIPPQYNSNTVLTVQIMQGDNSADFDLSSR